MSEAQQGGCWEWVRSWWCFGRGARDDGGGVAKFNNPSFVDEESFYIPAAATSELPAAEADGGDGSRARTPSCNTGRTPSTDFEMVTDDEEQ